MTKLGDEAYRAGLGVILNGEDTGIITVAAYDKVKDIMTMPAADLRQLRIPIDATIPDDADIDIKTVAGLKYVYDEPGQLLKVTFDTNRRIAYDVAVTTTPQLDLSQIRPGTGFLLNYDLYAASKGGTNNAAYLNAALEGRVMTRWGTLNGTGTVSTEKTSDQSSNIIRLDTTWRTIDPVAIRSYAVGDVITGSVGWSSAYRLGGIQVQSAFTQRPDIITAALPQFSGSSALPSTVELFINNSKVYSGDVPSGPFNLNQLPAMSGGDVRLVTRDANGNQQVINGAYYYSPDLLRAHLFDYSGEAGFLRYGYGQKSFQYGGIAATGSARYGLTGDTTLEGHAEAARGFANGGLGINQRLGGIGVLELAGAISSYEGQAGEKVTAQINTLIHGVTLYAGTERRFGNYFDLARVSAIRNPDLDLASTDTYTQLLASTLGAKSIDRAGVSAQLPFDRKTSISVGYNRIKSDISGYELVNFSGARSLGRGFGLMVNGYRDLTGRDTTVMVGLTKSFGGITTMASAQRSGGQNSYDFQASGSAGQRQDSINWSVLDRETQGGDAYRSASIGYRPSQAWIQASVQQSGGDTRVIGQVTGSLVAVGGTLNAVNRVGDSFVLVRGAGPDAIIQQDGLQLARTGNSGTAFLPDAMPYRPLNISIDPTNMPVGWQVEDTQKRVVTAYRNGAVVDFHARHVDSAILKVVDKAGKAIEPGYVLKLDTGKDVLIGYDGEAYVDDIKPHNSGLVDLGVAGVCHVSFDYAKATAQDQQMIGPVVCAAATP